MLLHFNMELHYDVTSMRGPCESPDRCSDSMFSRIELDDLIEILCIKIY